MMYLKETFYIYIFIFQLREYPCNITHDILFLIYNGYFKNKNWYPRDIFRTWIHILRVNVKFYDAVNIIHDVITTPNPFPYTAKFTFVGVRNNEAQQIRRWKINSIRI